MGAVYEAEQNHPKRRVALKVIRAGLLSRSMLRRFSFEVEMLGRLQHPGIAQIHEAGTAETDAGLQPYFAMEFVDGRPLSKHAADLEQREKLQLLAKVADAIHYAHQNGIIHRDLKPDNILVDEHGQPKVLDFGVARSTNADLQATMQTQTGTIVGTLSYMSPEQAAGEAHRVDVRSDVYALGVIAYQLLTGRLPYELPRDSLVNALRLIREVEPAPASSLQKDLRGDVENILLKALDKERERRYQSAHDLAADIRRHLNDEPITARPADTLYQLRKFVRRNRTLVAGVAASFVLLVLGLVATTWQWRDAVVHRRLAEEHATDAQKRLLQSLVAEGDALALAGRWVQAKDRHLQALARAQEWGQSLLPAQFGFWEDRRHSPEALTTWNGGPNVRSLAFSPDGRMAISGGGLVRLWDVARGTSSRQLAFGDSGGARALALSVDGRSALIGTGRGSVFNWNLESGDFHWFVEVFAGPIGAVAFVGESDRPLVQALSMEGQVALLDAADGSVVRRLGAQPAEGPGNPYVAGGGAISPDGRWCVVAHADGTVTVCDTRAGESRSWKANQGNHGVAFCPDSRRFVTASADKTLQLWEAESGRLLQSFEGHDNGISSVAVSADGSMMLSASWDRTVRLWDIASGRVIRTFTGPVQPPRAVAFAGDQTLALSADEDGTIRLWSLRPERQVRTLLPDDVAAEASEADGILPLPQVNSATLSPDGRLVAAVAADGRLRLWDVPTGLLLRTLQAHDTGGASAVAFCMGGARLLTAGSTDGQLRIWPVYGTSTEPLLTLDSAAGEKLQLAVAPDGRTAIAGGTAGVAEVWDLENGQVLRSWNAGSPIFGLALSADGARAAAALENSALVLWDPATASPLAEVSRAGGFQDVTSVRFAPGEMGLLAAGGWSGLPRMWRTSDPFAPLPDFTGGRHTSTLIDLEFTSDGRYLITAGWDNTVRVWDVGERSLVRSLADHDRPVVTVDASRDSRLAVSGSWDGAVMIWELSSVTDFYDQREAVAKTASVLAVRPDDPAALMTLANWYARRGADGLAVAMLAEAAEAGAAVSHLQLARCYVALGRWEEAREEYERARLASEAPAEYLELCLEALERIDLGGPGG